MASKSVLPTRPLGEHADHGELGVARGDHRADGVGVRQTALRQRGAQHRHPALAVEINLGEEAPGGQGHVAHGGETGGGALDGDAFER